MNLSTAKMDREKAEEILNWKYKPPYDFYNNEVNGEELEELLNGTYFAIIKDDKETAGFFCTGESAQVSLGQDLGIYQGTYIDMGLGMNPKDVGNGKGTEFGRFVLEEIEEKSEELPVRLTVAAFNKRAIRLYEKLGFASEKRFSTEAAEFMVMVRN